MPVLQLTSALTILKQLAVLGPSMVNLENVVSMLELVIFCHFRIQLLG
jgi:hypothetical protein